MSTSTPRVFALNRTEDDTGISGTGFERHQAYADMRDENGGGE